MRAGVERREGGSHPTKGGYEKRGVLGCAMLVEVSLYSNATLGVCVDRRSREH